MFRLTAVLIATLFTIQSCSFEESSNDLTLPEPDSDMVTTAISIGPECVAGAESQRVSFAHLSDLHANFAMQKRKFEKLKSFYQTAKKNNPYTLFTNAGDDYEKGSVTEAMSSGVAVKEAIFAMEFDIRTVGNHDFAWGTEQLLEYVNDPHAKVLATNTKYIGDQSLSFDAYDFVEAQVGCVKVGFFGMVSLPWNELDETYDGQFLPEVLNDFSYQQISEKVIKHYRTRVDILVFISHLGVVEDGFLADSTLGIDLILGGHSHSGIIEQTVGDTLVIQPDFYANGISLIDVDFNLQTQQIDGVSHQSYATADMQEFDTELAVALDNIADKYAKQRFDIVAYSEFDANELTVNQVSLDAVLQQVEVDAVLLNSSLVWTPWLSGGLSQQSFYSAYSVERQKSNTPGFNAIYTVSVSGADLKKMQVQQPEWLFKANTPIEDEGQYQVAIHKGAALSPLAFFSQDISYQSTPEFISESWQILTGYGKYRTSECKFIDSDNTIFPCQSTDYVLFDFNSPTSPWLASEGEGQLDGFTPNQNWFVPSKYIVSPEESAVPQANNQTGNILSFDGFSQEQGYILSHSLAANGDVQQDNKLAYYSLLFDLYVPEANHDWLAILQTNLLNNDDAELFVHQDITQGIGGGLYFSGIEFNSWKRIAIVVNANSGIEKTDVYVEGVLLGSIEHEDLRWAIESSFLLFTDNNAETRSGFVDNILLVNKPLTEAEILRFGGAEQVMSPAMLPTGINE